MLLLVAGCARPGAPESVASEPVVAGEPAEAAPLVVEEPDAPGVRDTAVPLLQEPAVSTTAVPGLQIPDGFSSSFGDIPELEETEVTETGPGVRRPSTVSRRRSAASLFRQLGDACPPEAVATDAQIGALTGAQLACAEIAIGTSENRALRNQLSLALIANALALGDASWVGLVERHLHEIDPANPSLALRLALYHHEQGSPEEAQRWSASALEHRSDWPPAMYEDRTWLAHQVHTSSVQARWVAMDREGQPRSRVAEAREDVVRAAREWAEYARHVGRRDAIPVRICEAAGGDCQ